MIFLAGAAIISAALVLVVVARREANRPGAPSWLRTSVLGNTVALVATAMLGSGVGLLLQEAAHRGDAIGAAAAMTALVLPFAGLRLLGRRRRGVEAETATQPPTAGGRSRRGRPDARPAPTSDASVSARRAS